MTFSGLQSAPSKPRGSGDAEATTARPLSQVRGSAAEPRAWGVTRSHGSHVTPHSCPQKPWRLTHVPGGRTQSEQLMQSHKRAHTAPSAAVPALPYSSPKLTLRSVEAYHRVLFTSRTHFTGGRECLHFWLCTNPSRLPSNFPFPSRRLPDSTHSINERLTQSPEHGPVPYGYGSRAAVEETP